MRKRFRIVLAILNFTIIGGMALQVLCPAGTALRAIDLGGAAKARVK